MRTIDQSKYCSSTEDHKYHCCDGQYLKRERERERETERCNQDCSPEKVLPRSRDTSAHDHISGSHFLFTVTNISCCFFPQCGLRLRTFALTSFHEIPVRKKRKLMMLIKFFNFKSILNQYQAFCL